MVPLISCTQLLPRYIMKASQLLSSQCRRHLASLQPNHAKLVSPSSSLNLIPHDTRPIITTRRNYHASLTPSSDNLLGYSPMAQSTPTSKSTSPDARSSQSSKQGAIWGVDSNTAGGGVWAQTSAKKDKLNELLTELNAEGVVDTGVLGESLPCLFTDRVFHHLFTYVIIPQEWNR